MRARLVLLRAGVAWMLIILYLCAAAYTKRLSWQNDLAQQITANASDMVEHGDVDFWLYLYGDYSGQRFEPSWQASGVYLIEHGRHDPQLERTLLLLEARRTPKSRFLQPWCFNWDLRQRLIEHCLAHFPDDPRVAWAAGRIYIVAGRYEQAAEQLRQVLDAGLDPAEIGDDTAPLLRNRYLAALAMCGRAADAEAYLARHAAKQPAADTEFAYLEYLCREGKYSELAPLAQAARAKYAQDRRFLELQQRAAWWSGDLAGFRTCTTQLAPPGATKAQMYDLEPRLALLDGDFPTAKRLLEWPQKRAYRAFADAYGVTHRPELLQQLLAERERLGVVGLAADDEERWDNYQAIALDAALCGQILRAYTLAGEYSAALKLDASLPKEDYDTTTAGRELAWLLGSLAEGKLLRLRDISALIDSGGLPDLLVSEQFRAALAKGPYQPAEALAWVRLLARPKLDTYYDSANGGLEWPERLRANLN